MRLRIAPFLGSIILIVYFLNATALKNLYSMTNVGYAIMMLTVLFCFTEKFKLLGYLWPLLLAIIVSLTFNSIEPYFRAGQRFISWMILIVLFGPFARNSRLDTIKEKVFILFPKICLLIGVLSFLYWALDLPKLNRGYFAAFMAHPMLLGPIAGFGAAYGFIIMYFKKKKTRGKFIYFLFFGLSFYVMMLTASRAALFSTALAILIFLYSFNKRLLMTILLLSMSFLFISDQSNSDESISQKFVKKFERDSRGDLWLERFEEFKNSPLYGSGFARIDPEVAGKYKKENRWQKSVDRKTGNIEPGSSYLALISMTGLLGIIGFLYLIFALRKTAKVNWHTFDNTKKAIILLYLGFFIFHLIPEGYIFSSGSLLSLVFWNFLGTIAITERT